MFSRHRLTFSLLALAAFGELTRLAAAEDRTGTWVDADGVMRWTASNAEIARFGVNYTAPFAYAYRAHQRLGIPLERAIDADVYHFARLGFDAYRVHMWDREITDADGNLLNNEHLVAFDYLLAQLKRRGIKSILTPLQFGDAGYPERGVPLPGFSSRYGKAGCLEDRTSWPLQARYLAQLMEHVNPHTAIAYKNEPDLLAFEICNEPGHFDHDLTVAYIDTMVQAIRSTGCTKPIFYNMSHGLPAYQAYLDADVQGGTFQWYPSNLVAGHEQRGNFLPAVDDYPIPFADAPKFKTKAKMIYEFDAADIGRSYIYPAIARTFRTAGFQFATQFAYDPLYLAPFNTEYQTHYLNLAYSPQKALGLKIAAEAFRRIPRGKSYGAYPANTSFEGIRVSYEQDLAELVTDRDFFYSNTTATPPPAPARLEHVAGYGHSAVVNYPGQGAYFLDRLEPGVWRLEVMPDAIPVRDPFEKPSPDKQVTRIAWNQWPLTLRLPDLGEGFTALGLNDGNTLSATAAGPTLAVRPGVYLLTRQGVASPWNRDSRWSNLTLKEFVAPAPSLDRTCVLHQPPTETSVGADFEVAATIATPDEIESVELFAYLPTDPAEVAARARPDPNAQPGGGNAPGAGPRNTGGAEVFPMSRDAGLRFVARIPGEKIRPGTLRYQIVVTGAKGTITHPAQQPVAPTDWRFHGAPWSVRVVPPPAPLLLFDAATDARAITADHRGVSYDLVPSDRPGTSAMAVVAYHLADDEHDSSCRYFFRDKIAARLPRLASVRQLVIYGRSATAAPCTVQLALATADGFAYGASVEVPPHHGACAVPLAALKPVRSPNLPHGYPVFIPFWSPAPQDIPFDARRAESVLVSIGPGLAPSDFATPHGVEIERIWLE